MGKGARMRIHEPLASEVVRGETDKRQGKQSCFLLRFKAVTRQAHEAVSQGD